jgi:hypothetical protein
VMNPALRLWPEKSPSGRTFLITMAMARSERREPILP